MANESKIDQIKTGKPFSRFDYLAIVVSIILCVALIAIFNLNKKSGDTVQISLMGSQKEYPLNKNQEIVLSSLKGDYVITIKDNAVYVKSSPCKGQDCVKHARIRYAGDIIVCTDLKIIITIKGSGGLVATT